MTYPYGDGAGPYRPPGADEPSDAAPGAGADRSEKAPAAHSTAYRASGALALLTAGVLALWVLVLIARSPLELGTHLSWLVRGDHAIGPPYDWYFQPALGPAAWAVVIALTVMGVLALRGRPVARGGVLALAALLVVNLVRQGVAVLREPSYPGLVGAEPWPVATLVALLVTTGTIIALMSRATTPPKPRREFDPYAASSPVEPRRAVVGLLALGAAVAPVALIVHQAATHDLVEGVDQLLAGLADPAHGYPGTWGPHGLIYWAVATSVALAGAGVLHLLGRRSAHGALYALLPIQGYLQLRTIAGFDFAELDQQFATTPGTLAVLTPVATLALATASLVLLATRGPDRRPLGPLPLPQPLGGSSPPGPQDTPPPGYAAGPFPAPGQPGTP